MRIVFMGTPDFAVGTLQALAASGHEIVGVVTQPDKPKGRGKTLQPTPVKEEALKHGYAVYQPVKVREPEFIETLQDLAPDVIVVVAFGQIIPAAILHMPRYGCLNVHASLLPKYRGAAPIQWAIIDGEKESGVTIMQMDEGLDTGDMIARVVIPIGEDETGGSLFDKLSLAGADLLVETLAKVEAGEITPEKQPAESTTAYAKMLDKKMGNIDWSRPAQEIACLIRGLNPWPSAYTHLNGKTLKIWRAAVVRLDGGGTPGEIVKCDREGITVLCGTDRICIEELQLEGKKRMASDAFLRGYSLEPGTILEMNRE